MRAGGLVPTAIVGATVGGAVILSNKLDVVAAVGTHSSTFEAFMNIDTSSGSAAELPVASGTKV
jgi:hypothetical protein